MTKRLPQVTPEQCDQITGKFVDRNHAAHIVFTTYPNGPRQTFVAIGECPGRHAYTEPARPVDPFALLEQGELP